MKKENTLENGTFARVHLPDEIIKAMEQETLKKSMSINKIQIDTNKEFKQESNELNQIC